MTRDTESDESDGKKRIHHALASRRQFLEAAGAAGMLAGVGGVAVGQDGAATTYEFGGEVSGWQGRAPSDIEGETNPTLELEAGTEYEVVWENLDGQDHDFVIQDDQGNELAGTEIMSEQGATRSFTFTASEAMAQYICTVHPTSMVGDIQVGPGAADEGQTGDQFGDYVPEGPTVGLQQVAAGPLVNPVDLRSVPGEEDTHLIVDQTGEVYVHQGGELQDESFLDLSGEIVIGEETRGGYDRPPGFDERGLLGMDFHPDFEENGQFYVRYSSRNPVSDGEGLNGPDDRTYPEDWDHIEVLSEFQLAEDGEDGVDADTAETDGNVTDGNVTGDGGVNVTADGDANVTVDQGGDGNVTDGDGGATDGTQLSADPDSERVLLEVPEPQFNHNGGQVVFGPDGYLYTSYGDGGDGNDTGVGHEEDWYDQNEGGNAQNVEANLLGTVVRIDVDEEGDDLPYGVPDENPLVDTDGYDEIYAYGLRNPWRMSFDDDQLIAADVGQALFEEVDVIEEGGNYGWNVKEGFHCFNAADATSPPVDCPGSEPDEDPYDGSEFVDPVLEYPHRYQGSSVGISITGGYVYGGEEVSDLDGRYVFGDWSAAFVEPQGRLFVATPDGEDGEVEIDDTNAAGGGMNATDGNATVGQDDGNATGLDTDNTTGQENGDGVDLQTEDNQTQAAGNETGAPGNETVDDGDAQQEPQPEEEVDLLPPDEHPWQWEEIMVEGGQNQRINRFIQAFGRDDNGEVYVLASQTGRIQEANGEVFRIVPAGEGDQIEQPDAEIPQPEQEETEDGATDDAAGNETAGANADGNVTADGDGNGLTGADGNATTGTDGDVTGADGNLTGGNVTADNEASE